MQSLKEKYNKEVVPEMMKRLGYKNPMAVPSIKKVVLNSSLEKKLLENLLQKEKKYKIL